MSHFNMIDTNRLILTNRIFKETEYPKISVNERVGILDAFFLNMSKHDQQIYNKRFRNLTHNKPIRIPNNLAYEMEQETDCNELHLHDNNPECDDIHDNNSTTATMSQLSQDLGNYDIHDLHNSVRVYKKRTINLQSYYSEQNALIKQTCNFIDTDHELCDEFNSELKQLCNKFNLKMMKKNVSVSQQYDTNMVSSHVVMDKRTCAKRYKTIH